MKGARTLMVISPSRLGPVLVAGLVGFGLCDSAEAAVRVCGTRVSSDIVVRQSEREAKTEAIRQWRERVAASDATFNSWRLAYDKALKCFETGRGLECLATGVPCKILQNPSADPRPKSRQAI